MKTCPSAAPGTPFMAPAHWPEPASEKVPFQVSGVAAASVKPVPSMLKFRLSFSVCATPSAPSIEPSIRDGVVAWDSTLSRMPSLSSSRSTALATPSASVSIGVMVVTATLDAVGARADVACTEMVRAAVEPDVVLKLTKPSAVW
ncbi:hypothetical protein LMG5911_03296 [Achromobacter spanius]|nr:hypothetical protein LMG5911_03296 [Achromobacter spanius]